MVSAVALAALGGVPGAMAPAAFAQDRTASLADIRTELGKLTADLQALRAELVASGPAGFAAAGGDSAIDRMNAMEAQMAQLTGQTEQLQNRIDRIVRDGTTRIGDIEFRLCEMEPNCDLGSLTTPDLGSSGGGAPLPGSNQQGMNGASKGAPNSITNPSAGVATEAETADFDRAREVLGQGDFRGAADLFAAIAQSHAGGPLTAEALFLRGAALDGAGDLPAAGEAWLASFAANPNGPQAPDALLGLSRAMASVATPEDGCYYLYEILARFPDSDQATEAERRVAATGCDPNLTEESGAMAGESYDSEAEFDGEAMPNLP